MTLTPCRSNASSVSSTTDVQPLYDLIHGVATTQVRHTNRLLELAAKGDAIDERVGAIDQKVDTVLELLQGLADARPGGDG